MAMRVRAAILRQSGLPRPEYAIERASTLPVLARLIQTLG